MSHVQNSIQEWIDDLIPIKTTLNDEIISKLDTYIIEACKKLHAFITRLYKDMYENPDKCELFIEEKDGGAYVTNPE